MQTRWTVAVLGGLLLVAVATLSVPSVRADPLATVDGEPLQVQADRLEVDLKTGHAVLSGDVRIRHRGLDLTCGRVVAAYDKAPAVRWAKATGGVHARVRDLRADASEAEISFERRSLVLRGDVRFRRGGAWMRAREASIDLKTNKVTLERVRGAIPLPSALALPGSSR